jgi:hypothetical protein
VDRSLFGAALLLGAISVLWMGTVFVGTNALALTVIVVIGCVYGIGVVELAKFRQATSTLSKALSETENVDSAFDNWLEQLDPSIRNPVRMRIEGDRSGLPAPVMAPYLVGLLVMLGLLGTFVGMVETLTGAVNALEGTTELQAIREGLAEPMRGLGLAFGTSVAGVSASAMLGLMSTISRRARILETRRLDAIIQKNFKAFSLVHSQRATLQALQVQTQGLPEVVVKLDHLADSLSGLGCTLVNHQEQFHASVKENYTAFTASLENALEKHLKENIRQVGATVQPVVQGALSALGQESQEFLKNMDEFFKERSLSMLSQQQGADKERLDMWAGSLDKIQESTVQHLSETTGAYIGELKAVADGQQESIEDLKKRFLSISTSLISHIQAFGQSLETPLSQLFHTAAETHGVLGKTILQIRQEQSDRTDRDTRLLEEQHRILEGMESFVASMSETTIGQGESMNQLVEASRQILEKTGRQFVAQVDAKGDHLSRVADAFAGSAVEMASLGDAFGSAVDLFTQSNHVFIDNLSKIEAAMDQVAARSDTQLAYYIAQAREIIDQCMLSQKEMFSEMNRLRPSNDFDLEAG